MRTGWFGYSGRRSLLTGFRSSLTGRRSWVGGYAVRYEPVWMPLMVPLTELRALTRTL